MKPEDTGSAYNQITHLWEDDKFNLANGMSAHQKAIEFVEGRGDALDVGCGLTCRFIDLLVAEGFSPEGVDISSEMINKARLKRPRIKFHLQDICEWEIPIRYDFITAWDSIWHVPLNQQSALLTKLIDSLNPGGVFIFSFGGVDNAGEHTNKAMGPEVYYSSLGLKGFLSLFMKMDCIIRHLEFDQHPETHTYAIIQKTPA